MTNQNAATSISTNSIFGEDWQCLWVAPSNASLDVAAAAGKTVKIGAKVVRHSPKIILQMAEVAVPRELFQTILERIGRLILAATMSG
jgi:hypothetical protein